MGSSGCGVLSGSFSSSILSLFLVPSSISKSITLSGSTSSCLAAFGGEAFYRFTSKLDYTGVLFLVLALDSLGCTAEDLSPLGVDFAESYFAAPGIAWVKTFFTFIRNTISHLTNSPSLPVRVFIRSVGGCFLSISFKFLRCST